MKLFRANNKGSITVMVVLILVPTIFFNGFMVDLARIKLYSNQALLTADNYGEAVLSCYDNVLKELYGLFAISQDEDGKKAIEALEKYMSTSFNPNSNTVSSSLATFIGNTSYNGMMPYKNADVQLDYKPSAGANLGNSDVLATQIGDFMKFRIAQQLWNDDSGVMDAIDMMQNISKSAKAIQKQNKVVEKAEDVLSHTQKYYELLDSLKGYTDFINNVNHTLDETGKEFDNIKNSSSYKIYKDYNENKEAIERAEARERSLKDDESLTSEEEKYVKMGEDYDNDDDARTDKIKNKLMSSAEEYKETWDVADKKGSNVRSADFGTYENLANELYKEAKSIKNKMDDLEKAKKELDAELAKLDSSDETSKSIKSGIDEDLKKLDELFEDNRNGGKYSADLYINLADELKNNIQNNNSNQKLASDNYYKGLRNIIDELVELKDDVTDFPKGKCNDFVAPVIAKYKTVYDALDNCFGGSDNNEAKKAEKKKKEAKDKLKETENKLKGDEETDARDIPSQFGLGTDKVDTGFALSKLIDSAASYLSYNNMAESGNALLLKFYTVEYDFGMFSSRVTNVDNGLKDKLNEKEKSLTGYEFSKNINYLYKAEVEYLFGGSNSSKENLAAARDKILAFRGVVNYAATYQIAEINSAIRTASTAASAVNPVLGVAVGAALRLAVTGVETALDWSELKKGESVPLIKKAAGDLTVLKYPESSFASLIGCSDSDLKASAAGRTKIQLDYEQYLVVMLMFLTTQGDIMQRTSNLITLNVNTVNQKINDGELNELKFKMNNAVTAVDATCAVHMDFVVMPQNFAKQVTSGDTYEHLQNFEKNIYKYTVTRGY